MTEAMVPPAESEFGSWYASLEIQSDPEIRQNRWKGVVAATKRVRREDIETFIGLAFRMKKQADKVQIEALRQKFLAVDDTFSSVGNDRELEILAAACLARMMEIQKPPLAALMVMTTECKNGRTPKLPMDIVGRAEAALLGASNTDQESLDLTELVNKQSHIVDFTSARTKIETTNDMPAVVGAFTEAEQAVNEVFDAVVVKQNSLVRAVQEHLGKANEELQMLWWLIGQRSWDLDCSFDNVPADARPLVMAKELVDHTQALPGPPSIGALLSRAGLKERKKISIVAAVNSVSDDWVANVLTEDDYSPVTLPIHFALKRRSETGSGADWAANWAAVTGVAAAHEMSSLSLGVLFYRERLLATIR